MSARLRASRRYRITVAARSLAAVIGGYGLAALFAAASARLLPMPRIDAAMPGTMLAFLVMPAVAIWAFLAASAARAWAAILIVAALLALPLTLMPR